MGITFRRDPNNFRPRINKMDSTKDKEQKESGNHFCTDEWFFYYIQYKLKFNSLFQFIFLIDENSFKRFTIEKAIEKKLPAKGLKLSITKRFIPK
jgi:hypothetical protein